jgi:CheY-like chemotaxis protein
MARLLIVEDDRITALALQRAVTRMGHRVVARVFSAAEAMAAVQAYRSEVVLLDIGLTRPQDSLLVGVDIQTFWSTPVIFLSGSDPTALGLPEFPEALWCYVAKPIDWEQLRDILARLFPAHPPRPGTPGSGGEDTPYPPCARHASGQPRRFASTSDNCVSPWEPSRGPTISRHRSVSRHAPPVSVLTWVTASARHAHERESTAEVHGLFSK